jgi:hypothetical protein
VKIHFYDYLFFIKNRNNLIINFLIECTILGKFESTTKLDADLEKIYFSDSAIRSPGMYRLAYIAQRGNIIGILGVSAPFSGCRR